MHQSPLTFNTKLYFIITFYCNNFLLFLLYFLYTQNDIKFLIIGFHYILFFFTVITDHFLKYDLYLSHNLMYYQL